MGGILMNLGKNSSVYLDLLFARLTWPSLMVRERTCNAIAELLVDPGETLQLRAGLLRWMHSQQLESVVLFGLLILIRARILDATFEVLPLENILRANKKPSILSFILLRELGYGNVSEPDLKTMHLPNCPDSYETGAFFKKYVSSFLPPAYEAKAIEIENEHDLRFLRHWAFESESILEEHGRSTSHEPLYFGGRPEQDHYDGVDYFLSEVYRSAYLRTLAWAAGGNGFSEKDASYYAVQTCPIDPSLWNVRPVEKPCWWPLVVKKESIIDTRIADIWSGVEQLWERGDGIRPGRYLAQASGRVCNEETVYDLEIRGIFQRSRGGQTPELGNVFKRACSQVNYYPKLIGLDSFIYGDGVSNYAVKCSDWEFFPVACYIWPYTTPRWQFYRLRRLIWIPAPFLAKDRFAITCKRDQIVISEGDDMIGEWLDWNWNLREKNTANLTPATGECLFVEKQIVDDFVAKHKCTFAWVCQIVQYHRDSIYHKYKEHRHYNGYGTTRIIL